VLRDNLIDPYVIAGGNPRTWIHTDNPLQSAKHPRIKISKARSNNDVISLGTDYVDKETVIVSIIFFTKNDFKVSLNSVNTENELLVEYYLSEIKRVLKEKQTTLQAEGIDGFKCVSTDEPIYNPDTQVHFGEILCRYWFFNS
jgi:hypothetical protein